MIVGSLFGVKAKEARNLAKTAAKTFLHPFQLQSVGLAFLLHLLQLFHHPLLLGHGLLKLWSQLLRKALRLLCLIERYCEETSLFPQPVIKFLLVGLEEFHLLNACTLVNF